MPDDLKKWITDGVILCKLINKLYPGMNCPVETKVDICSLYHLYNYIVFVDRLHFVLLLACTTGTDRRQLYATLIGLLVTYIVFPDS